MSKTFEEFWYSYAGGDHEGPQRIWNEDARAAWDHQQERIDEMEKEAKQSTEDYYKWEKKCEALEKRLEIATEAMAKIRPAVDIVADHYLAFEEHAGVVGVCMERESAERVKRFWEAHEALTKALDQIKEQG